jgi:LacI family transcriptional regulator
VKVRKRFHIMATIVDVAEHAGVSTTTVSRVLNGTISVNPEMSAKVRASVAALNYRPSRAARALRSRRAKTVGLLISDIQNPFFTALIRGVEDVAQQNGYSLILCNSDEDPRKERQYLEVLCAEQVSGAIIVPTSEHQPGLKMFREQRIPVVTIDRRIRDRDTDAVLVDNVRGASEAVTHLLQNGYRRVGIITGPMATTTGSERLEGYRQALSSAGIEYDHTLVRCGSFREESGCLLAEELLDLDQPVDALFAGNNAMSFGVFKAIDSRGLRVPEDIGMVGFDDMPWASLRAISLTTVAQPVYELGNTAASRLFQRLLYPDVFSRQEIVLTPWLCIRGSSRMRLSSG